MNYKNKDFGDSSDQQSNQFAYQNIPFAEILNAITNNSSVPKILSNLRKITSNRNFKYQPDFLTSGFAQFLISSIAPGNAYICDYLDIIKNLTFLKDSSQYSIDMCGLGLISSLNNLLESLKENKVDSLFHHKIINIIIILNFISNINMDIKNSVVNTISLEIILNIAINYSEGTDLIKFIYYLFGTLLNPKEDEELDVQYISNFEKYFPLFVDLFIKKKGSLVDIINVLKIYIILTKIPSFSTSVNYFDMYDQEHSIIDEIMEMIYENNDEILEAVLAFDSKIMIFDYLKTEKYTDRYVQIFEKYSDDISSFSQVPDVYKHKIGILYYDSMIIQFIIEHRPDWIPDEKFSIIAFNLMKNVKNSSEHFKSFFLNCLFALSKRCDTDCFFEIIKNSFALLLTDFLDVEDDDLILSIIDEINFLTDKEMEINETQNVLYEFLDNGGLEFFQDYQSNGTNQDIALKIDATVQKYVITL